MDAQTILIVEDEFLIRFMLGDSLRVLGYRVLEAASGDEGYDVVLSGQAIDLVITDVNMPGAVDGMELTRRLKSLAPDRPVIVCSAHLASSDAEPADAFLAKPYMMADLSELIERLIGDSWQKSNRNLSA